jgi:hypothetical protein
MALKLIENNQNKKIVVDTRAALLIYLFIILKNYRQWPKLFILKLKNKQ